MREIVIDILNQHGYIGIMLLILLENLFPPIPSELILTFSGFMTTYTRLGIRGVVLASTAGSMLGAVLLYLLGKKLSINRIVNLLNGPCGKILRLQAKDVLKAVKSFESQGSLAVFVCRCIPILRSLISVPAGMAGMNFQKFFVLSLAGTLIWNTVLCMAGAMAGTSWEKLTIILGKYAKLTKIGIAIAIITIIIFYKKRKTKE